MSQTFEDDPFIAEVLSDPETRAAYDAALARDRYPLETFVSIRADDHQPDRERGGCTCGFCAWSPGHVAIMAYREAIDDVASLGRGPAQGSGTS